MTPEAQRIAIAEACGWKQIVFAGMFTWQRADPTSMRGNCPDYLKDLNAMHEAEKVLPALPYLYKLQDAVLSEEERLTSGGLSKLIRATAAQRAEAFLKTIGKWVD